jgi:hypothetical protein
LFAHVVCYARWVFSAGVEIRQRAVAKAKPELSGWDLLADREYLDAYLLDVAETRWLLEHDAQYRSLMLWHAIAQMEAARAEASAKIELAAARAVEAFRRFRAAWPEEEG